MSPSDGPIEFPVSMPNRLDASEIAVLIEKHFNLPPFCSQSLRQELEAFLERETAAYHAKKFEADFASLTGPEMIEQLVDQSEAAFAENGTATPNGDGRSSQGYSSDEMLFAHAYHSLIQSNALHALLSLERQCSRAVASLIDERDQQLDKMERQQQAQMEAAISQAGSRYSDEAISRMAQMQWEEKQLLEAKYASELEHMKAGQRREYRAFVLSVHERAETTEQDLSEYMRPAREFDDEEEESMLEEGSGLGDSGDANSVDNTPWEESFTIVLGKQLKTSHHFRLLRADILDFCRPRRPPATAQRLNTAMTLYADRLSGLVLLVDNRLNTYSGVKREFARVCERATEFHFPELPEQFERLSLVNAAASERRQNPTQNGGLPASASAPVARFKSPPSLDSDLSCQADEACSLRSWTSFDSSPRLQVGDVYVTRHSNLSEAHVVFHLVVDDSVFDTNLSSLSPIVRGLANIFRGCFQHDVVKLTLPLLLAHYTCEEMTAAWCTRRVDMVYKAVKAGIIEGSTWLSHESRLIQFAVPPGLSDEMLASFRDQLPSVFHLANPVKG